MAKKKAKKKKKRAVKKSSPSKKTRKKKSAPKKSTSKGGPKPIKLTKEQEKTIKRCAAIGVPQDIIADLLGISESTLQRRLKDTPKVMMLYKKGCAEAHVKVINKAFQLATDPLKGSDAGTFFWLKTRLGWKETQVFEVEDFEKKAAAARAAMAEMNSGIDT